jgi:hypothetical protein
MNAYNMIMESSELLDTLEWNLANLKAEIKEIREQLCTARKLGLGHNLLADDLIKKLGRHLAGLEAVAKQAQEKIKQSHG